ncbi:MAG TPA: DUF3301 domain-containing protein [Porticoccus sp.]|nr:DUF3301 domain-containing protein [Porticoccus sp.]
MFDLNDVLFFTVFLAFVMLWWNAQGVKQMALQATRSYCKKMEVQLLDDVVFLRGFWFKRNSQGQLCIWRSYNFEFTSTGNERYSGQIVLLGRFVDDIRLEPYRIN